MQALISQTLLVAALLAAVSAGAQEISVLERRELSVARAAGNEPQLRLTLALLEGAGWDAAPIEAALRQSAGILAQCGIALARAELVRIRAPARFRDFHVPASRELARALALEKPTVYFVADTRQRPAFDAEAIGWSNGRSRPELIDTVWITRAILDLGDVGVTVAHELAHILMDSGEHSIEPGNLMNEDTAPGNTRLSADQCNRLNSNARANGLLRPPPR
jgi:hypothetical protein